MVTIKTFKQNVFSAFLGGFFCLMFASLMRTTFTYVYDNATPVGTDVPSTLDDQDRNTKLAIQERENVDHYWALTGTQVSDAATGEHRKISFHSQIADPTNAADKGFLYMKDASSHTELFWQDESGNVLQLSSAGEIPQSSIENIEIIEPPTGAMMLYGNTSAPSGWLLCNGSAVSRTTYSDLFAIISTSYGVGDGATTFNLPDMRGRVGVGLDTGDVNLGAGDTLVRNGRRGNPHPNGCRNAGTQPRPAEISNNHKWQYQGDSKRWWNANV